MIKREQLSEYLLWITHYKEDIAYTNNARSVEFGMHHHSFYNNIELTKKLCTRQRETERERYR